MPEPRKTAQTVAALVVAVAVLAACGGSSKPSYCSSVSTLESSIKALPSTNILQTGLNGLETAVSKVQTDAQTAINSAKSDFPTETSALNSSITALSTTVKSAVSTPSPGDDRSDTGPGVGHHHRRQQLPERDEVEVQLTLRGPVWAVRAPSGRRSGRI